MYSPQYSLYIIALYSVALWSVSVQETNQVWVNVEITFAMPEYALWHGATVYESVDTSPLAGSSKRKQC